LTLYRHQQISHRRGLRALACSLVFLGICVFAWGLRYKLSLYDPPHATSRRMPAAKLLTGRERGEATLLNVYRAASPAVPAVLVAFTLTFVFLRNARRFPAYSWRAVWLAPFPLKPSRVAIAHHSSRPPPRFR
jgi:hypothetical protein